MSFEPARALRVLDAVPVGSGAAVMGTGVVSIALLLDGERTLSQILLGVCAALWVGLLVLFAERALRQRARWREEARAPSVLTAVAATAVLGNRVTLLGERWTAYVLLAVALCLWFALLPRVVRHWRTPTVGVSFMLPVATESLSVLVAVLAFDRRLGWLAIAALVLLVLGLGEYLVVLARADLRQLFTGHGDQWIFGGALAIATLACARTTAALTAGSTLVGLHPELRDVALALWAAAVLWLPALLAGELVAPRVGYEARRWSTVFPLGMYAVCSVAAASTSGIGGIRSFGRIWVWVAFAVWTIVVAGTLRRAAQSSRGGRARRSDHPTEIARISLHHRHDHPS